MKVIAAGFYHRDHHRSRRSHIGIGAGRDDFELCQGIEVHEVPRRRPSVLRVGLQHVDSIDQRHHVPAVPIGAQRLLVAELTAAHVRRVRGSDTRGQVDRLKDTATRGHTVEGGASERVADHGGRDIDNRRLPVDLHPLLHGAQLHDHIDACIEPNRQGEPAAHVGPEAREGIFDVVHARRQTADSIRALAIRHGALFALERGAGHVNSDTR